MIVIQPEWEQEDKIKGNNNSVSWLRLRAVASFLDLIYYVLLKKNLLIAYGSQCFTAVLGLLLWYFQSPFSHSTTYQVIHDQAENSNREIESIIIITPNEANVFIFLFLLH